MIECSSTVCQEISVSKMRLHLVFVVEETCTEVSGKRMYFVIVSVYANASLSCANPSNVIGSL